MKYNPAYAFLVSPSTGAAHNQLQISDLSY